MFYISQIEIGNDCAAGFMRNRYDANHRVIRLSNTFFTPEPVPGAYSAEYKYDLAGNILNLNRHGLLEIDNGVPVFGPIDSLSYTYADERLSAVTDEVVTDGQPQGFGPTSSVYTYDNNGNLTTDDGKGLAIHYNLLNLPDSIGKGQVE